MSTEALAAAAPLSLNLASGRATSPSSSGANKTAGVAGRVASLNAAAGTGSSSTNNAPSSVAMGKSGSANNASTTSTVVGTSKTAGAPPEITSPHELTAWVEDVLSRLETSFDAMSGQVLDRLETISKRIDTVEQSISDLVQGNVSLDASEQQANTSSS